MNDELLFYDLEIHSRPRKRPRQASRAYGRTQRGLAEDSFTCQHCHAYVLAMPLLSGVHNRNHCPYCLWSRCLDLYKAGDRLSACRAPMQPVGLALKATHKKYGEASGELMLVHRCGGCGRVWANRIAADDDPQLLYRLYEDSLHLNWAERDEIAAAGVGLLDAHRRSIVQLQLFGKPILEHRLHAVFPVRQGLMAR